MLPQQAYLKSTCRSVWLQSLCNMPICLSLYICSHMYIRGHTIHIFPQRTLFIAVSRNELRTLPASTAVQKSCIPVGSERMQNMCSHSIFIRIRYVFKSWKDQINQIKLERKIHSKCIQRPGSLLRSVIPSNSVDMQSFVYVTICLLF